MPSKSPKRVALPASHRKPLKGSTLIGPVQPDETIEVTLRLRRRAASDAAKKARASGRALSRDKFEELFGADPADVARHETVVAGLGLPVQAPAGLRADDLLQIMARDKKAGGGLTFVLRGPSGIELVDDPDPAAVRKAFAVVGVEA